MEFVDTHCHLQFEGLINNIDQVLANAAGVGVSKMICIGTTLSDSAQAVKIARAYKNVWSAVGVHPHDAKETKVSQKKLEKLLVQPKVVAIGETGLDYYKNFSSKESQRELLKMHIQTGLKLDVPFIFHVRNAWDDFFEIFDWFCNIRGVVHSFSATTAELEEVLNRNLYVGLNGIMTFTKDEVQLEAAKLVPLNKLLLETDAPFLTPAPQRGEQCEPKHVVDTAKFLAKLRGESLKDLAAATTANAIKLFGLEAN